MTPDLENWEEIQRLFHLADDTPNEQREGVLAEACHDPALRSRALALHRASLSESDEKPRANVAEQYIGPYKVIRHLGSGGMGAVYAVERSIEGVVQRCALKVLAPHA